METLEIKDITPLLTGVITATAAILAVIVTSLFNLTVAKTNINAQSKQKTKELKLEKLEELYMLFDKWQLNFSQIYLLHLRCYRGLLKFQDSHDLIKNINSLAPGEAQKYKMIMMVHFPSLADEYEPVEVGRKLLVPFLSDPNINKLPTKDFENLQISFEKSCEKFKSKISFLAHITANT